MLADGHGHSATSTGTGDLIDVSTWTLSSLTITPTSAANVTLTATATEKDGEDNISTYGDRDRGRRPLDLPEIGSALPSSFTSIDSSGKLNGRCWYLHGNWRYRRRHLPLLGLDKRITQLLNDWRPDRVQRVRVNVRNSHRTPRDRNRHEQRCSNNGNVQCGCRRPTPPQTI